ncbi:PP2C family protein-serine/threonine phosphatase [Streptomyces sp. G-G2]|uniref:PP2C family protein-serine/threonine phosphatase n=1 Tax=Streptomyces sp. G-G2 TaxID=3046201 RepID=UPI0024BBB7B9|nr:PP2C family protein-serine/threonine phosphatase [Streptomyces sp. G-G2]MDJ0381667.1 PP2C family protein-serine/threonine phosphatase [Streptomyces sp. G-G2]
MITRGEMPHVRRVCVLAWGGAAVSWELASPGPLGPRLASCAAFLLLATGCALHIRKVLLAELRRSQELAGAVQRALLRPVPARIDGLTLAAAQLSVGGDLYEAVGTPFGVRVVIGDVRGHGLGALGVAAAVLGSFREAAYDEATLGGVLRRMERALARQVRGEPEEFVTVLLLQIAPDGTLLALNCGHPWPYALRWLAEPCRVGAGSPSGAGSTAGGAGVARGDSGRPARRVAFPAPPAIEERGPGRGPGEPWQVDVRELDGGERLPPLGVVPLPHPLPAQAFGTLGPGEALFLHTDGIADARDRAGRFFPLARAVTETATTALTPARLVAGVHAALLRHTGGRLADDVALLVLRNDRLGPA